MRMLLVALFAVGVGVSANAAQTTTAQTKAATQVCTLKVTGMTCAGCEAAVKIAAKKVDGVASIAVSYDKASAEVKFDPAKTSPAAIAKVISEKTGYKAVPQSNKLTTRLPS